MAIVNSEGQVKELGYKTLITCKLKVFSSGMHRPLENYNPFESNSMLAENRFTTLYKAEDEVSIFNFFHPTTLFLPSVHLYFHELFQ